MRRRACSGIEAGTGPAVWHGLPSCGPAEPLPGPSSYIIPGPEGPKNPLAGAEEWQCTELADRWLYMAFGIPNQGGDGAATVYDYWKYIEASPPFTYPLIYLTTHSPDLGQGDLSPGDVISYSGIPSDPDGHVAIVTSVTYGGTNPGYTVIEQNPSDITRTIPWEAGHPGVPGPYPLLHGSLQVAGWLHFTPTSTLG